MEQYENPYADESADSGTAGSGASGSGSGGTTSSQPSVTQHSSEDGQPVVTAGLVDSVAVESQTELGASPGTQPETVSPAAKASSSGTRRRTKAAVFDRFRGAAEDKGTGDEESISKDFVRAEWSDFGLDTRFPTLQKPLGHDSMILVLPRLPQAEVPEFAICGRQALGVLV